jgi:hypothetical protein
LPATGNFFRKPYFPFEKSAYIYINERKKIKRSNLGLAKKENYLFKQLDERICVLFLLSLKNKLEWFILAPLLSVGASKLELVKEKGKWLIPKIFCE